MSEDFDVESLASYLHLEPAVITKMASRGKLPGRRIQGAWRFASADIFEWLEERIGASDDDELDRLEEAFDQAESGSVNEHITLKEFISPEAMSVPMAAKTRNAVIKSIIEVAMNTGLLWDPDKLEEAVRAREEMMPTTLPGGVALLHPRRPNPSILGGPFIAFGKTYQPIPFGGDHGGMTDLFFLICSTDDQTHLRVLARLTRMMHSVGFLDELREQPDAQSTYEYLLEQEEETYGEE